MELKEEVGGGLDGQLIVTWPFFNGCPKSPPRSSFSARTSFLVPLLISFVIFFSSYLSIYLSIYLS